MKNLYPKGKGKIHPSPASPSAVAGGGGSSPASYDALAVLKLLPAAILALTVAMSYEGKEVLAYLITRSIQGGPATGQAGGGGGGGDRGEERPGCKRAAAGFGHRPALDCGCFDCYTSFWSRWDCSPDRELIHQAIEAFEEHLACSEKSGGGRGRRRERKSGGDISEKGKKGKDKEKRKKKPDEVSFGAAEKKGKAPEEMLAMVVSTSGVESFVGEEMGETMEEATTAPAPASETIVAVGEGEEVSIVVEKEAASVAGSGERRRGWPDVMGIFNWRLWSLWGPGV